MERGQKCTFYRFLCSRRSNGASCFLYFVVIRVLGFACGFAYYFTGLERAVMTFTIFCSAVSIKCVT